MGVRMLFALVALAGIAACGCGASAPSLAPPNDTPPA
jgi:hypothetical protein